MEKIKEKEQRGKKRRIYNAINNHVMFETNVS